MKRLVRSALDPLPRSLSTRSLAILVAMLVAGIAISVSEYLESGRSLPRASTVHTGTSARRPPAPVAAVDRPSASAVGFEVAPPSRSDERCGSSADDAPATDASAGVWIPEEISTGS